MNIVPNTQKEEMKETRNIKQKKLDREHVGRVPKKKGQTLYAMCLKSFEVYEVHKRVVESRVAKVNFKTGSVTNKPKVEEYIFVKGDPVLWSLNMKNACRKFQKMIDGWYKK